MYWLAALFFVIFSIAIGFFISGAGMTVRTQYRLGFAIMFGTYLLGAVLLMMAVVMG